MNLKASKLLAVSALVVSVSSLSWAGDKTIQNRDGSCMVSVPANWTGTELPGIASSPDKQLSLAVSSPKMVDSFSELKQTAKSVYKNSKVTKDSATEFEMEGESIAGKPDVYRAIPGNGNKFCIAEVTYQGAGGRWCPKNRGDAEAGEVNGERMT
jgi:hypothetical protein